jgi:uncharacterized protein YqgC (DUF456 family)
MVVGVLLASLQLPGTWLVLAAAVGYDWLHDWQRLGFVTLGVLAALAVTGEVLEQVAGMFTARRAGGSRRAGICGFVGGIVGMFVFALPLPIIGAIIGGLIGCFVGAVLGEMSVRSDVDHGTRVGVASVMGRLSGMLAKLLICVAMAGAVMGLAIFSR